MERKPILVVGSDRQNIEQLCTRIPETYTVIPAVGASEALKALESTSFALMILNSLTLPDIDALQFLRHITHALPKMVCVVISDTDDINLVISVYQHGGCFMFLRDPCSDVQLHDMLRRSYIAYMFSLENGGSKADADADVVSEKNASGVNMDEIADSVISCLLSVLALVNPAAYSRASRIATMAKHLRELLGLPDNTDITRAGLLSQMGCVTVSAAGLEKMYENKDMDRTDRKAFEKYRQVSYDIAMRVKGFEASSQMILKSKEVFDGPPPPPDPEPPPAEGEELKFVPPFDPYAPENLVYLGDIKARDAVAVGADILKAAIEVEDGLARGLVKEDVIKKIKKDRGTYNPLVVAKLGQLELPKPKKRIIEVSPGELTNWMTFEEDVVSTNGMIIMRKGQRVNEHVREKITNYSPESLPTTICVSIPHYKE